MFVIKISHFVKVNNFMKYIIIFIFLAISTFATATSYYISPSGNDSNSGAIGSPFFTLNKAWSVAKPGDIIYARGGTYRFNSRQNLTGKSGTASDTIRVWAYPGERPVFTKSTSFSTPTFPVSLVYVKANYIHLKGIEIAYFSQATSAIWYGIAVQGSNHNKFEKINSHHNGHGMVIRDECSNNLVLNCDFHHNSDPLTPGDGYGNADGLAIAYHSGSVENTVKGCRLWNNSDDGLDLWQNNGNLILEGSWAWRNGYRTDGTTVAGDGCGFKFGSTTTTNGSEFRRTVKNNISIYNRSRGYMQNAANARFNFYNNIAWKNPMGMVFPSYNLAHVFRNNIVFENNENWNGQYSNSVRDHNSNLSGGPVASASDFISMDTTGISKPRKANGDLPDINFMKLASGSDLIDAGIDVGISFDGSAPDLGAYENRSAASAPALAIQSAVVKNTNPSEIEVTYNLPLSTTAPAPSCFEVKINSITRSISKLTIIDKTVYLTLTGPVKSGETVLLSYTKPSTSPLQCTGGTIAESISAKAVVNSIESAAPVLVSSVVDNDAPDKLKMTYNVKLANIVPLSSSFITKINGQTQPVMGITISESTVILTLAVNVGKTDTVTIAYNQPATDPIQTVTGGKAETLTAQLVANNTLGLSTGSESTVNGGKILLFPNPAKDYVKIANFEPGSETSLLRLYDMSGKLCQEIKLENLDNMRKLPIKLVPGLYIAQVVKGSDVFYVQKLIVIK